MDIQFVGMESTRLTAAETCVWCSFFSCSSCLSLASMDWKLLLSLLHVLTKATSWAYESEHGLPQQPLTGSGVLDMQTAAMLIAPAPGSALELENRWVCDLDGLGPDLVDY